MQMGNGWKGIPELWERDWSSSTAQVEAKHRGHLEGESRKGEGEGCGAQGLSPGSSFLPAISLSQTHPNWDKNHETF